MQPLGLILQRFAVKKYAKRKKITQNLNHNYNAKTGMNMTTFISQRLWTYRGSNSCGHSSRHL